MTLAPIRSYETVSQELFDLAHDIVTRSGAAAAIDAAAAAAAGTGGRKPRLPQYTADAVLTGLLMLALCARPLSLANLLRLLWDRLDATMRETLGLDELVTVDRARQIKTSKRAYRNEYERLRQRFDKLIGPFDPSPHPRRTKESNDARNARERRLTDDQRADLARRRQALLALCNSVIRASLPARPGHHDGSFALDGVMVEANAGTSGTGTRAGLPGGGDPDAGWWFSKTKNRPMWAYCLVLAIATHPLRGRSVPNVVAGMSIGRANGGDTAQALEALDAAIANDWGPRPGANRPNPLFVADRGYTAKNGLADGLTDRAYDLCCEYSRDSRNRLPDPVQRRFPQGPIQYNGVVLCPAALGLVHPQPDPTGHITPHPGGEYDPRTGQVRLVHPGEPDEASPTVLATHHQLQAQLEALRMPTNGKLKLSPNGGKPGRRSKHDPPTPTRALQVICPAHAEKARCPHHALSMLLKPGTVPDVLTPPAPDAAGKLPACCSASTYTTVHLDAPTLKKHQAYMAGSDDHADRYGGSRSHNEQWHSQLKDRNASALDDDAFELTGISRVALICALAVAATNIHQNQAHDEDTAINGGLPPHEPRHEQARQRAKILAALAHRRNGKNPTRPDSNDEDADIDE